MRLLTSKLQLNSRTNTSIGIINTSTLNMKTLMLSESSMILRKRLLTDRLTQMTKET